MSLGILMNSELVNVYGNGLMGLGPMAFQILVYTTSFNVKLKRVRWSVGGCSYLPVYQYMLLLIGLLNFIHWLHKDKQ